MTQLNTRLIVSAEDRGAAKLLNRLGAESEATVKQFSKMGSAFSTLLGGFSIGYGTKKALSWVDDYRMDILSIATTLSDTWKDTGKSMEQVFAQNKVHAESFFKLLRLQARRSISSFEELKSAYAIFASKGMALDVNIDQAKTFADLVDRITLATRGQNKAIQVQQELRAILEGRARPTDVLAKMFMDRDATFIQKMKKFVAERDTAGIVSYMGELMADIPLDKELSNLLSKQLSNVQNEVKFWAKDAFAPLYEVLIDIAAGAADDIAGGNSPFFKGLEVLVKDVAGVAQKSKEIFQGVGSSEMGKFLIEAAPRFVATSAAVLLAAKAFSTLAVSLKAAAIASTGGLGAVALAAGGVAAAGTWSQNQMTREQAKKTEDPLDYHKAFYADMIDGFIAWFKGAATALFELVKSNIINMTAGIKNTFVDLAIIWETIKGGFFDLSAKILTGVNWLAEKTINIFNFFVYESLKLFQYIKHPMDEFARNTARFDLERQKRVAIKEQKESLSLTGIIQDFEDKSAESKEKADKWQAKKDPFNFMKFIFGDWNAWGLGEDVMTKDWMKKQSARQEANLPKTALAEIDGAALTGKPKGNLALLDSDILSSSRALEKMAKAGAELESVIAQMESSMARGGSEFDYALSQVNKEYMKYKAKIVRFAGEQENVLEALTVEQADVQKMLAQSSGVEREILLSKNNMLDVAKQYAVKEQAILEEKKIQADIEKRMSEAKTEEVNILKDQLEVSKQREREILIESEAILKDLNKIRGEVAMSIAGHLRDVTTTTKTSEEADRLENKVLSLLQFQSGLPGKGGAKSYAAQAMLEAANLQKQLAEIGRSFDIAGARETEAQALERKNNLQRQYLELYRETANETEKQITRLNTISGIAESNNMAGGFLAALHDMEIGASDTFEKIKNLTLDIFSSMESTMSNVFFDAFSGQLASAKDYFAAFGKSILQSFSNMLAKMLAEYITETFLMKAVGGILSFFWADPFTSGIATKPLGGANQPVTMTAANGGIAQGGFRALASGGIVNKPTFGLIGEGYYNEAVVPLPDGRTIPVTMNNTRGNTGTSVTVNLIDNSGSEIEKTVNKDIDEQGNLIVDIILDAVSRNKRGARAQFKSILGVS